MVSHQDCGAPPDCSPTYRSIEGSEQRRGAVHIAHGMPWHLAPLRCGVNSQLPQRSGDLLEEATLLEVALLRDHAAQARWIVLATALASCRARGLPAVQQLQLELYWKVARVL